jgi:CAF1 family ribonuclease
MPVTSSAYISGPQRIPAVNLRVNSKKVDFTQLGYEEVLLLLKKTLLLELGCTFFNQTAAGMQTQPFSIPLRVRKSHFSVDCWDSLAKAGYDPSAGRANGLDCMSRKELAGLAADEEKCFAKRAMRAAAGQQSDLSLQQQAVVNACQAKVDMLLAYTTQQQQQQQQQQIEAMQFDEQQQQLQQQQIEAVQFDEQERPYVTLPPASSSTRKLLYDQFKAKYDSVLLHQRDVDNDAAAGSAAIAQQQVLRLTLLADKAAKDAERQSMFRTKLAGMSGVATLLEAIVESGKPVVFFNGLQDGALFYEMVSNCCHAALTSTCTFTHFRYFADA